MELSVQKPCSLDFTLQRLQLGQYSFEVFLVNKDSQTKHVRVTNQNGVLRNDNSGYDGSAVFIAGRSTSFPGKVTFLHKLGGSETRLMAWSRTEQLMRCVSEDDYRHDTNEAAEVSDWAGFGLTTH